MNDRREKDESFNRSFDGPTLVSDDIPTAFRYAPPSDPAEQAAMEDQWRGELSRLEGEISTLTSVLNAKQRQATELKRCLGITPLQEIKQNLNNGVQTIKESDVYKNTNEKLHQFGETISSTDAYQKTNSALKSFGIFASKKLDDLRGSDMYKSVEEKVSDTYTSVKTRLSGSQSASNVREVPTSPIDSLLEDDEVYSSGNSRNPSTSGHK